jgi:alanine or glycine:cation symporter, AGCS family
MEVLSAISGFVWGPFLLVPLLLLTGLYLTIVLRGLQFRILGPALHLALIKRKEDTEEGDISHYQALMTALAATIGTGNIVGVATAIAAGGPGALFWMWVTALVGMATKYSEGYLGVKYRVVDAAGERLGGPMEYLTRGVGGSFGRILGLLFAIFASIAAFGIGNMVQSNAVSNALNTTFGVPSWITGIVLVVGAGAVILGGIKSIGRFTGFFVPLMAVLYMLGATVVLAINYADIPAAIALIFTDAFTGTAAVGGFAGAGVMAAIRFGVARGIFSNESGLGTGGIAAAAAQTRVPARQAMVSMTQTFIDTIIVVSFTGLVIITTGLWQEGLNGSALTTAAFSKGMPGNWGGIIVAVGLSLFAFSTLLGWAYYGERNIDFLFGRRAVTPYRLIFIIAIFIGTVLALEPLWLLADILNGLMALPNLIGLLLLSGVVARESLAYFFGNRREE